MPTFKRQYTQAFVDLVLQTTLAEAKDIEGHRHVQAALASLGVAPNEDGIYFMDSVPAKEQIGIVFDFWLWRNYKRRTANSRQEETQSQVTQETEEVFEFGGKA